MSDRVSEQLGKLLANSYTLYLKTQNYHWNVTGMNFKALHDLFQEQYEELAEAVDEVAEQIKTRGATPPGSFKEFLSLTTIDEGEGTESAIQMVKNLQGDHESIVELAQSISAEAEAAGDDSTVALLDDRIRVHEKAAWMLRATAE